MVALHCCSGMLLPLASCTERLKPCFSSPWSGSGTAAKAYAQTQQQNYPLQAKKHKLTSFKVLKWTVVVGAVEAGVQFCSLLFARVEPVRAFCVLDHSAFGILLLYAPFVIKVRSCLQKAIAARLAVWSHLPLCRRLQSFSSAQSTHSSLASPKRT